MLLAMYMTLEKLMGWQWADLSNEPSLLVCILMEEGVFSPGFCYRGCFQLFTGKSHRQSSLAVLVLLQHCMKHGAGGTSCGLENLRGTWKACGPAQQTTYTDISKSCWDSGMWISGPVHVGDLSYGSRHLMGWFGLFVFNSTTCKNIPAPAEWIPPSPESMPCYVH